MLLEHLPAAAANHPDTGPWAVGLLLIPHLGESQRKKSSRRVHTALAGALLSLFFFPLPLLHVSFPAAPSLPKE